MAASPFPKGGGRSEGAEGDLQRLSLGQSPKIPSNSPLKKGRTRLCYLCTTRKI
jgi:hypothetical protein